jgi:hypothetical protein
MAPAVPPSRSRGHPLSPEWDDLRGVGLSLPGMLFQLRRFTRAKEVVREKRSRSRAREARPFLGLNGQGGLGSGSPPTPDVYFLMVPFAERRGGLLLNEALQTAPAPCGAGACPRDPMGLALPGRSVDSFPAWLIPNSHLP